jgi:hypothetical protein
MVARLIDAEEVGRWRSGWRTKRLTLTAKGQRTVEAIQLALARPRSAPRLPPRYLQQQGVAQGLQAYAQALQAHRLGTEIKPAGAIQIVAVTAPA